MRIEDWGLIDYESAVARQSAAVDEIAEGSDERIVFCTHPPIITLGRASRPEDLSGWTGAVVKSSRGGRVTYHGPSQIVIYPLLDLRRERAAFAARDVHAYLRALERATVTSLRALGLAEAEARETRQGDVSLTGVWIGDRKIASIGIAVRRWITYHGVAVSISEDPQAFTGIRPCGFSASVMTSAQKELGRPLPLSECKSVFQRVFAAEFAAAAESPDCGIGL